MSLKDLSKKKLTLFPRKKKLPFKFFSGERSNLFFRKTKEKKQVDSIWIMLMLDCFTSTKTYQYPNYFEQIFEIEEKKKIDLTLLLQMKNHHIHH